MKVLITDGLGSEAISTLRKLHEVDVQELDSKGLLSAIPEYHALIVRSRTTVSKPDDQGVIFWNRSEEHTSELQSRLHLVCRLLLEKKKLNMNQMKCK